MSRKAMSQELHAKALQSVADIICAEAGQSVPWVEQFYRNQKGRLLSDVTICAEMASKSDVMVDIGCAPFFTTAALSRLGYNIVGVDIAPERFRSTLDKLGLRVAKSNFEVDRLPFEDDSVDLVLLSEVFEHLRIDLIATMREVRRVIKPGGHLLVSTPNVLALPKLLRMLLRGRTCNIYSEYEKLHTVGHMGHVREYAPGDISEFFRQLGFERKKTIYRGSREWGIGPRALFVAATQRLIRSSRTWFMLVLEKTQASVP